MRDTAIRCVYVWELPVRFYHWINAVCVLLLVLTGIVIGRPLTLQVGGEASFSYWFGTVRFIHFVAAFDIDKNKVGKDLAEAIYTTQQYSQVR